LIDDEKKSNRQKLAEREKIEKIEKQQNHDDRIVVESKKEL